MTLRNEADLVRALSGTVRLSDLYHAAEEAGLDARDNGGEVIHGTGDTRCRRRVRNALQAARRSGRARRIDRGRWVLDDTVRDQARYVLLLAGGEDLGEIELAVSDAADLFRSLADDGVVVDLALCDPPWGLARSQTGTEATDGSERIYARDSAAVVGGYVDTDRAGYAAFSRRWIEALAELLRRRPGSQCAIFSGPEMAGRIQVVAEDAGLTFVTKLVASKVFPLYAHRPRRPAFGHYEVVVLAAGRLNNPRRFFFPGGLRQRAASGRDYPTTWLGDVGRADRPGQLRYDNALPPGLVSRLVSAFTAGAENGGRAFESLVVDGFCGGGTTALEAVRLGRRVIAGDANARAVALTAGRVLDEVVGPAEREPTLFDCA